MDCRTQGWQLQKDKPDIVYCLFALYIIQLYQLCHKNYICSSSNSQFTIVVHWNHSRLNRCLELTHRWLYPCKDHSYSKTQNIKSTSITKPVIVLKSSVSIVTKLCIWQPGFNSQQGYNFPLRHYGQTGPTAYPRGTGGSLSTAKVWMPTHSS